MTGYLNLKRDDAGNFPWWLVALGILFALLGYKVWADELYQQILSVVSEGIWITLYVTAIAFALAVLLGLLVALAFKSRYNAVRQAARFYCEVIRGIPVLVLLFYMAFVAAPVMVSLANTLFAVPRDAGWLPQFEIRDFSLTWRAIIALTISYSAFPGRSVPCRLASGRSRPDRGRQGARHVACQGVPLYHLPDRLSHHPAAARQ